MQEFHILNSKEKKKFHELLQNHFDCSYSFPGILFKTQKNKYFMLNETYSAISDLHLNKKVLGLYVAETNDFGEIRLSIEGSQLVGPHAKKHVLELQDSDAKEFMMGKDIKLTKELPPVYHIIYTINKITHEKDFIGCGKVKDTVLFNFIPKGRRIF